MSNDKPIYYSVQQVTEILNVHENTVYNWIETGKLKAVKIGDLWRIPKESLPQVEQPTNKEV